ncbi:hypothetical protein HDU84_007518 [Entophlyctis sp. JEL0112]|nr:hypothetical protein HDU84_007518 [Entophlyctis sp. JEL0112]
MSAPNKDLALISAAEMRIALAESEDAFGAVVGQLLCPLLRKLASPLQETRNRILEVLKHVSVRTKSLGPDSKAKLPLEQLVSLYAEESMANEPLLLSITLMYVEMAIERLVQSKTTDTKDLIRSTVGLFKGISSRSKAHQQIIFSILVPIMSEYKEVKYAESNALPIDPYGFGTREKDFLFLLEKLLDLVLYSCPPAAASNSDSGPSIPPGLSENSVLFVTRDRKAKWTRNPTELRAIKSGILRFLQIESMTPQQSHLAMRFVLYSVAVADPAHEVISAAQDALKRLTKPSMDDAILVSRLFRLYQGVQSQTPSDVVQPASPAVKIKILNVLATSVAAANTFPQFIQVIFDALYEKSTTPKIRMAGMAFMQWVVRMATDTTIKPVGSVLLSGVLKLIDESDTLEGESESLRGFGYDILGALSKRVPALFVADIDILKNLFKAVSQETRNVRVNVQDALSAMIPAYRNVARDSSDLKEIVEKLLLENIDKPEHHARFSAVKYANALFPFSSPTARFINLVALADSKLEVKEEGRRGLELPAPAVSGDPQSISSFRGHLPLFHEICACIKSLRGSLKNTSRSPGVKYVGNMSTEAFAYGLEFLMKIIAAWSEPSKKIDGNFGLQSRDDDLSRQVSDAETRAKMRVYLRDLWTSTPDHGGIESYLELIELALKNDEVDAVLQGTASSCLVDLISLCPSGLAAIFQEKVDWIRGFLSSNKTETRLCMAKVLGIVTTADLTVPNRITPFIKMVEELRVVARDFTKQTSFESRHGAVLALGFILGRLKYRQSESWRNILSITAANEIVAIISEDLDSSSSLNVQAACLSLAEVARYGSLVERHESESMEVDGQTKTQPVAASIQKWTFSAIIEKLKELGKSTKDTKVEEAAITTLGQTALGDASCADSILDYFFSLPPILSKNVEVNFTVGDAICSLAGGFEAANMLDHLDIADVIFPPPANKLAKRNDELMIRLINHCVHEASPNSAPVARKAGNLQQIHSAFSSLISDRDEFTQEVASKGIGLVYELGDASIKASLVQSLVSTFTEGRKLAPQSVSSDTTLFQDGSLGQTPDGANLTTYQSILSLASDLNQPDLVYKFMSLASHNAIWNSRRGASMGFGSIASLAERELAPYISQLVPKLYRFQFDPNQKVAESMKSIWKSLVKDPRKAIDENFEVIMKDLLKSLGDRLWRIRESGCLALSDLLHGRQLAQLKPFLQEIWAMCFRVLDDIKESVRVAAFSTCKTLTNVTVKYCDPTVVTVSEGQAVMDIVMPFFLTKGLNSKAEEVSKFSLATVLKITKKGGVLLKPHMADLISTLLESLTVLEPQVMSYLTFHTASYNITQEQLDSSRLSAAKSSPMMEAIDSCVENLDENVLESLMPKLLNIIKKGVGLPTKAGSARFVVTLVMRAPAYLRPFADSVLKAMTSAINDRSHAVRKSFATAVGHIAKLCSIQAVQRLIGSMRTVYTDSEESEMRSVPGIVALEMSRFSNDMFAKLNSEILPLAFVGRHDADSGIKTVWTEVWEENTASASNAVKLYMEELLQLCSTLLSTTPSWNIKKQVGLSLKNVATAVGSAIATQMNSIIPLLVEALAGRTWDGKEAVLDALVTVSLEGKEYFLQNSTQLELVTKVVIREAKKNNKTYKRPALECLGRYIDGVRVDAFEELKDYLEDMAVDEGDADEDDNDDVRGNPLNLAIRANAFKALGKCFPYESISQAKSANEILVFLAKGVNGNAWNTKLAILEAIDNVFSKCARNVEKAVNESTLILVIQAVHTCLVDGKYTSVRESSLAAIRQCYAQIKETPLLSEIVRVALLAAIDEALSKESLPSISEPLKEVRRQLTGMNLD